MSKFIVVFNPGPQQILINPNQGHYVYAHEWAVAKQDDVQGHIDAERLLVIDPASVDDKRSNPEVILLKKEAARLNEALEVSTEAKAEEPTSSPTKKSAAKKR